MNQENDFKIPAEIEFMDDLPKNILGKIMKKKLRESLNT